MNITLQLNNMDVIEAWAESQDFQLRLDSKGKIIDYFDEEIRRENKPEERVRQKMACILHKDFRYPINVISLVIISAIWYRP